MVDFPHLFSLTYKIPETVLGTRNHRSLVFEGILKIKKITLPHSLQVRKLRPREVGWLAQGRAVNLWPGQGKIPAECSFHKLHQFGWFIFWLSVCTAWTGIVPSINGPESAPAEEMKGGLARIKRSGFSFQLGCMTLGQSFCLFFFFFFLIFTTTKMSLGLDLRTSFICGLLPRTGGPVCSTVWEGSDVAFSSVEKRAMTCYHWLKFKNMDGGVSDTCLTWTRCFLFFFF